jgi:two-component system chemotaxis sensor kinase CheA
VPTDLKEFLSAYLVEAEEHLAVANTQLLAVEASQRAGGRNPRAVRDTFRALHTIKGLSAMVGVEAIVAIAHRMETSLRDFARSDADVPAQSIEALLRGLRAIENRVAALGAGAAALPPPPDLLAELDALDATESTDGTPLGTVAKLDLEESLSQKLAPFEVDLLRDAPRQGRRAIRAEFIPSPARSAAGLTINSVRERISKLGEIVKVLPVALPASSEAPGGLSFVLLLLTRATDEELAEAIGAQTTAIHSMLAPPPVPSPSVTAAPEAIEWQEEATVPSQVKGIVRVEVTRIDDAMERLSSLVVTRFKMARAIAKLTENGVNTRELAEIFGENTRQLRDLRGAIVRVRMVPVAELLERIPLLVRGLRRQTKRTVRLELESGSAELDKSVSERLFPVIVHLVRNAVDHAIETPDERLRRGKPEEGLLRVVCSAHSNARLELSITDDGRGIDRELIARRSGRALPATDAALLELLCIPGMSTRDVVTTTSGRGMGMDIVKRVVVDDLGGELEMQTRVGQGTTFILRVPLTISIVDAFSFECENQRFVVPVAAVEEIVEVDESSVTYGPPGGRGPRVGMIVRRGTAIPLLMLREVFHMKTGLSSHKAIVVRRAGLPIAFGVDRMIGQQEVVIRPIEDDLARARGVAGATDLGDGRPTLVLDLVALGASIGSASRGELGVAP